jgi:hypothetical protein
MAGELGPDEQLSDVQTDSSREQPLIARRMVLALCDVIGQISGSFHPHSARINLNQISFNGPDALVQFMRHAKSRMLRLGGLRQRPEA